MSYFHQNDLFRVLNEDHNPYLELYQDLRHSSGETYRSYRYPYDVSKCEALVDEINTICRLHTNKYNYNLLVTKDQEEARSIKIIQNFFLGIRNKRIFTYLKNHVLELSKKNPLILLKLVNQAQAELFEKNNFLLVFRLDGKQFPPNIVYKLFLRQDTINILTLKATGGHEKELERQIHHSGWYSFNVYKCNMCKTVVKMRPMKKIKQKKKRPEDNYLSWIQEMY
ncbi:unnamed protein product [Phaedon cochleariae]|uniref:Uncharacterized protein n=1 Tax=Phaedon cochleariae TaxID=80249 RepID=A0A9N9SJZ8_PHACE|nr:unnamed protein product [Phaedon cochleariae]